MCSLEGKGGPFKKSSQKAPVLLEQILMIVSLVVLILLVLLAIVVVRNKYKASRFKLLDNAGKTRNLILNLSPEAALYKYLISSTRLVLTRSDGWALSKE